MSAAHLLILVGSLLAGGVGYLLAVNDVPLRWAAAAALAIKAGEWLIHRRYFQAYNYKPLLRYNTSIANNTRRPNGSKPS